MISIAKKPSVNLIDIFPIKIVHIKVNNWEEKKKKILSNMGDLKTIPKGEFVESNFFECLKEEGKDLMDVRSILKEELTEFMQLAGKAAVYGSWIERSTKGMFHDIHNHGSIGYSAVCYVSYDSSIHTSTQFISPFNDPVTGEVIKCGLSVEEGDLILFFSNIHHYTLPNQSDTERIVLSFNLKCL